MNSKSHLLSDEKLEQIAAGNMWDFHGGVYPIENKLQSNQIPICDAGIPDHLIIGIEQKGNVPELLVKVGDTVLKGQPLTKVYGPFVVQHASSSGVVTAIEPRTDCHPSGLPVLSIVIETDGLDRIYPYQGFTDYQQEQPATLINAIQDAGIIGLGGAGFATHLKLLNQDTRLLIINAIECEPYITADDRLVQEHADEIIEGIQILQHILKPKMTIFAIEDNMPEGIEAFTKSLQALPAEQRSTILLKIVPTRYPSGSAKQLVEILTGEQTPIGKHSSELGIIMNNVGTAFAVKEAIINGKPLVSRIVTITGEAFARKGNASVRIGTPIQHLLDTYWLNAIHQGKGQKLIIGGPMMGFTVSDNNTPVTKICNCILAPTIQESPEPEPEMSCIRCSECAEACPVELLPQQLLWYAQSEDHKKLEAYDLNACIECGACAYVCPSHIPLVEYYRVAKAQIKTAKEEAHKAAIARKRHEDRDLRLEKEKQQRQLKHKLAAKKRKQQMKENNNGEDLVAAALARAKAKKLANSSVVDTETAEPKPSTPNPQVAAAIARAKAKKLAAAKATEETTDSETATNDVAQKSDPKKAAVAAAIARAKAKKLAAAKATEETTDSETATNDVAEKPDPKKAAVAAAIAKAKAKKLAAAKATEETTDSETATNDVAEKSDPKKAAVAAIAKAKAKKLAAVNTNSTETSETVEQSTLKKAASVKEQLEVVEPDNTEVIKQRALRKEQARLHKQALAEAQDKAVQTNTEKVTEAEPVDDKKAKIAAVIAKAKAKKLAQKDQ
ncbi:electron transport complex subunit RsxC [Psychromonas algicola]|uniref:electron transport complex subunit RsxC n=1 Tax=Psychromonas algicola TaxID=2555642 RepID=UPI0010679987|nr:electron transport complex subunit RsxC [Psychromonas sp. RZ5]TEW47638.1 electron transport complex subunit RsxC [Psychromonas sp. RZ5]